MTTYYVSSQIGNDNNTGTSSTSPFASLQVAANHTAPGDTVLVMNGTYTGGAGGVAVDITTSGTASAPITFEAAPGQTPIIDSSDCWHGILISASYIVVDGFTVVGDKASFTLQYALANESPGNATLDGSGITVDTSSTALPNHIIIQNNTVYNEPGAGITALGADYVQILNNTVHDNANWSAYGASGISIGTATNSDTQPGVHITISGNTVYNNAELVPEYRANAITDGEGIILDTNPGFVGTMLVDSNTVYNNGSAGIESFQTDNAVISNNILYGNNANGVVAPSNAAIFINQSNNVTVTHNSTGDPNDHTPPNPPVISGDTVDGHLVTLTGTAEANSTITVFDNSTQLGTAITNANGAWTFTTGELANGSQSLTATATDLSLNVSAPSSPLIVVLNGPINIVTNGNFETNNFNGWTLSGNLTSSFGPTIFIDTSAESGQFAAGMGPIGSDGTLSQSIATTPGQQYTLSFWLQNEGGGPNDFTATWNGQALLALTNSAAFGYTEYTYTVTATGSTTALQFSARQDPSRWDLDSISLTAVGSQAPAPPIINSFSPDTAPVGDGHTTATSITLTGSGEANSTVNVFDGTTSVGQASVNASGAWSLLDSGLTVGAHSFTATDTDANGTSAASAIFAVTVDAPTAPPPPPSSSNLVVNGGFETGDFTGWTTSGNVAQLSYGPQLFITSSAHDGQDAAGFGSVGSDGTISQNLTTVVGQSYTLDFWLGNAAGGPNDFTAKISGVTELHLVNAAAQPYTHYDFTFTATSTSTPLEFDFRQDPSEWHLDNVSVVQATGSAPPPPPPTPPAAPVIASFSPDTAPVGDGHTTATSITLTGTGEANSTVNVFDGTTPVGQASVNASGAWSLLDSGLTVGAYSFTATDTDANGTSAVSAIFAVTVDAPTAPPPPILTVTNDPNATSGQQIALSTLVAIADPDNFGYRQLELWDSSGTPASGQFVVNGVLQTGGHEIDVSPADVTNTVFDAGTSAGTDTLWARLLQNDGSLTGWQLFSVTVPEPTLTPTSDPNATPGQQITLSTLVTIADPGNVRYQQLELWDSNGTVSGGQFVVNGVAQTGGHEIDVSPANVANTMFDAGTSPGTDTLWAQLLQNDGTLTGWQPFSVIVPQPMLTVTNDPNATPGQQIALSTLVTIADPGNVGYQQLELWDSNGTSAGGQFVVNGVAQTGWHEIDVSPADVANTVFDAGTLGGSDTLWAQLLQNDGTLTGWQQFSVTDPVTISAGATVELGSAYAGAVTFAGSTGTLQLDNSASFSGTVAGMAGQDTIDFADIDPAKVLPPSYSGDASGGTLSVTDGSHGANIALIGNYMASVFVPSSDGHGGTSVVDPPALGGVQPLVTPPHA